MQVLRSRLLAAQSYSELFNKLDKFQGLCESKAPCISVVESMDNDERMQEGLLQMQSERLEK